MWRELREDVEDELARLTRALEESASKRVEILSERNVGQPSSWDRLAAAGVVHECYTGMENALKRIAKAVDQRLPEGRSWHSDLLDQLAAPTPARPAAISIAQKGRLAKCLALRHVARTHYGFDLDWNLLREHLEALPALVAEFAAAARTFLDEMDRLSGPTAT